jgi:hypothetical protein
MVNTEALMERAIESYMSETGVDTTTSEYYLQLTQAQVENYGYASFDALGTIEIGGTDTNVKARITGRVNPVDGKTILFVNEDGYVVNDGFEPGTALSMAGFAWKNASSGSLINPTQWVKQSDITNASDVQFAVLVA